MYEAQTSHPISLLSRDGALLVLVLTLLCACKCNNDVIIFQAYALGLSTVPKEDEVRRLVQAMHSRFSTVMIAEYIDESIVLARRVLCWTPEDTAYVVICTLVHPPKVLKDTAGRWAEATNRCPRPRLSAVAGCLPRTLTCLQTHACE